ncbi:MAG: hypothetical protein ACQESM_03720 [Bacteroidota bacterium]
MKKKKTTILLVLVFAGGVILSSCKSQGKCPGVYSKTDTQKTEQVS